MSDTIPTPVDLLRLAYGASDELDVWLDEHLPAPDLGPVDLDTFGIDSIDDDEIDAFLAVIRDDGIPPEHPRWPDGTPVYIGQRVRHQIVSQPGTLTSAWTSPDGVLVRYSNHAGWFRLDEMRRLDPKEATDE